MISTQINGTNMFEINIFQIRNHGKKNVILNYKIKEKVNEAFSKELFFVELQIFCKSIDHSLREKLENETTTSCEPTLF